MTHHNDQQPSDLETIVDNQPSKKKIGIVDTGGNITYSLITGTILDYCTGLDLTGIFFSRATATVINSATGGLYGWWREQTYEITKTTKEKGKVRKTLVDLLAFNTFQIPVYATAIAIGSLVSEGKVNWKKVQDGATYLATISPFMGPTMGWYMDTFRRWCGVRTAVERAYKTEEKVK